MICELCGGQLENMSGPVLTNDKVVGAFSVELAEYFECNTCGEHLYPFEAALKIDMCRRELTEEILSTYPISEFVSSTEAAGLLGISRQAFHKNKKIRRGFIHRVELDDKWLYLRKSVIAFGEEGDGRISIAREWMHVSKIGEEISFISSFELFEETSYASLSSARLDSSMSNYTSENKTERGEMDVYH